MVRTRARIKGRVCLVHGSRSAINNNNTNNASAKRSQFPCTRHPKHRRTTEIRTCLPDDGLRCARTRPHRTRPRSTHSAQRVRPIVLAAGRRSCCRRHTHTHARATTHTPNHFDHSVRRSYTSACQNCGSQQCHWQVQWLRRRRWRLRRRPSNTHGPSTAGTARTNGRIGNAERGWQRSSHAHAYNTNWPEIISSVFVINRYRIRMDIRIHSLSLSDAAVCWQCERSCGDREARMRLFCLSRIVGKRTRMKHLWARTHARTSACRQTHNRRRPTRIKPLTQRTGPRRRTSRPDRVTRYAATCVCLC